MNFIEDVIYGLKVEYGKPITAVNVSKDGINYETGKQDTSESSLMIPLMIELPISLRQAFLKSVGIHKIGYLESGEQEFLIDANDLIDDFEITNESYLLTETRRLKVKSIEKYEGLLIVVAKGYGQPFVHIISLTDILVLSDGVTHA